MKLTRQHFLAAIGTAAALSAIGVAIPAAAQDKKEIVIGATAGPYSDQIKLGIKPLLEKKGYRVRIVEFNDYIQPNFALAQGSIDANVFQHVVYLNNFSAANKLALSELLKVPTAPMGLYSKKHKNVDVSEGAVVAFPNDPTNAARALVMLQELGWVSLRDGTDPLKASERDVALNPKKLKLVPMDAGQLPRSLDDTDYSLVTGNFAISSGMKLTNALQLEKLVPTYQNIVAIRTEDAAKPWVKDISEAYHSRDFYTVIDKQFPGFLKTDYQRALMGTSGK